MWFHKKFCKEGRLTSIFLEAPRQPQAHTSSQLRRSLPTFQHRGLPPSSEPTTLPQCSLHQGVWGSRSKSPSILNVPLHGPHGGKKTLLPNQRKDLGSSTHSTASLLLLPVPEEKEVNNPAHRTTAAEITMMPLYRLTGKKPSPVVAYFKAQCRRERQSGA